jgi:hypothetical protein
MSTGCLFRLALFTVTAVWAADIQPLDLKAGLWETTLTVQTSGVPPMSPEVLAKLTPEQRAKIEAKAKAAAGEGPKTTVKRSCLEDRDVNKPFTLVFGGDGRGCKQTVAGSSATKREIRVECSNSSVKGSGTIQMEAIAPGNLKVTSQWSTTDGKRTMKITSTATAKWLGPICELHD